MIAKLAVWGRTRQEAIERLRRALDEYQVSGITTTLPFFHDVVRDQEFIDGRLDTGFISRFNERQAAAQVSGPSEEEVDIAIIAAALKFAKQKQKSSEPASADSNRWKLSGRVAALQGRQIINDRGPSKWRRS
jgi:acetyl/propionyl-CoA carboxylase alpha subunit